MLCKWYCYLSWFSKLFWLRYVGREVCQHQQKAHPQLLISEDKIPKEVKLVLSCKVFLCVPFISRNIIKAHSDVKS